MKREDIKTGEIYIYNYDDENLIDILRAGEYLRKCKSLVAWNQTYSTKENYNGYEYKLYPANQQQIMWFEYCEQREEYFSFDDYQKNILLEFIEEENILK